ncbi:hypothetical protein TanjilG_25022 [Lupinus angustifolius]|uniref:Uncharacterized protein n=1 Tax=Lupinus angustifolius TaxID=3871 RepID=A0A1J7GM63_LUPAN|nr:hypothetical protein TanjilG_25022 [Lupinus angustifolius]
MSKPGRLKTKYIQIKAKNKIGKDWVVEDDSKLSMLLECFIERSHEKTYVSRWNWPITKGDVRSSLLYVDVIEATTIKAGPFIALLLSPRVGQAVELENYQCFSPSIPSGGILESIGLPKGCSSALPLSKGGGTLILPLSAIAMSQSWKTPLLASALLLPQTDLGGDLYSNRRRELIDAMTALPCLKAAVFSGRVEGLSFYDSFRISDPYDMISGDPSQYSIKARASPLLDFTSN